MWHSPFDKEVLHSNLVLQKNFSSIGSLCGIHLLTRRFCIRIQTVSLGIRQLIDHLAFGEEFDNRLLLDLSGDRAHIIVN